MTKQEKDTIKSINRIKNRKIIQNTFFGIFLIIILLCLKGDINSSHQFCPYAAVCFGPMVQTGFFVFPIAVILGILILFVTIFTGRKFCSLFCFLGSLQELVYSLRKGKSKFKNLFPYSVHKKLVFIKYFILAGTLFLAFTYRQFLYMKFCPIINFSFFTRIGLFAVILVLFFLIFSFFIERFWCKYLCPYGALMNIFQFIGKIVGIKRNMVVRNIPSSLECKKCLNYCPMQIDLEDKNIIDSNECIHCLRCVRVCSKTKSEISKCIYRDNL